jgi:hypothetical protein
MKPKFPNTFVMLFVLSVFGVIIWGQDLKSVNEKNAHWGRIQKEVERITKSDPNSLTGNKIEKYGEINIKDANSLFSGWKFYGFDFSNYAKNPSDKKKYSLAFGLRSTLAVFSDSNSIKTFELYNGNTDTYGKFLKLNKIVVRDANDAKLVWGAFCEIYRKSGKDYKYEKISDNEWKLGINSFEQMISSNITVKRTNYFKVTTDPKTKQITEWKSITETSDKRLEKVP